VVVARAGQQLVIRYSRGRSCHCRSGSFISMAKKTADLTIGMQNGRAHEVTWSGHAAAPAACIVEIKAGELNVVRKLTPMRR
jgi:hypothetical protein